MPRDAHDPPAEGSVREALRSVIDPEVGMNIVDLGLVYGVQAGPQRVVVDLTMTTPACPMSGMISDDAREAISEAFPDVAEVVIRLVWDPPWDQSKMSAHAKRHFGWSGA